MKNKIVLLLSVVFLFATSAFADEQTSGYIGGLIGANIPGSGNGSSSGVAVGGTVGVKLDPSFGVGIWGTYNSQDNSRTIFGLPAGTSTKTFNLAGEVNFFSSPLHVGADLGRAGYSWSDNSNSAMIYGPEAGLDIPFGPISIGAEAHYLFSTAANSQNNLLVLGAIKVWF